MEMAESLIHYMITTTRQEQYEKDLLTANYLEELQRLVNRDVTCDCPYLNQ